MPNAVRLRAVAPPSVPRPITVARRPASTEPHSFCHRPARWWVTISGMRLTSIRTAISANSPDFAACVPRLFSRATPGGSQSYGASLSSPALVANTSFMAGAGWAKPDRTTAGSPISASASFIPAANSASVLPMVTVWPAPTSGARAAAASHMAWENRNSGSLGGFWMCMRMDGAWHVAVAKDKAGHARPWHPILRRSRAIPTLMLRHSGGLPCRSTPT